jgi:hypothetical protein
MSGIKEPIDVSAHDAGSEVAEDHSIDVEHRDYLESEFIT